MRNNDLSNIYELSIVARVTWHAHSLSNIGTNGSIRTMPRRQLLADGIETDALSGNIAKYHHAALLVEYLSNAGSQICPACRVHDGRRAFALINTKQSMKSIISNCGVCDCHGFLIPGKKATKDEGESQREKLSKSSLIEYSMALAIPGSFSETLQLYTRRGEAQMLLKTPSRSGQYAISVRYRAVGIGVDTERWQLLIKDASERKKRHQAILLALRDQLLSPEGAFTAKLLPHLGGIEGIIMVRKTTGRAPIYSALANDFIDRMNDLSIADCDKLVFRNINEFNDQVNTLINNTSPAIPAF